MHVFKDTSGQEWTIELTAQTVIRVKAISEGRFNLFDPVKDNLAARLADDLPECWEVLWLICRPQANERNISAEKFGKLLADDCLLDAQAKLFAEWQDFFHRLRRDELALVVNKAATYQAKKIELVKAKLSDPLLTTLDDRVAKKMTLELNDSFGTLAASLASTLGDSALGS